MSSSDPDEAWKLFYLEYGPAMFAWQLVESELATLFSRITSIPPNMAIQIFYAGTNFNTRSDVFSSALTACQVDEAIKTATQDLIEKAKQYSGFRNKIAHDQPLLHQSGGIGNSAQFEIVMVHGKGQFQTDRVKRRYIQNAITVADISEAARAFRDLANIIRDCWIHLPDTRHAFLDKLAEQLTALPNLPRRADQSPKRAKPKRQRPPSRE